MKPQFTSRLRYGLIAIGLATAATLAPAEAGPAVYLAAPAALVKAGSSSPEIIQVHSRRRLRGSHGGHWSGRGIRSGRNWSRHGHWPRHGNWSGRRWRGDYWDNGHWDNWWWPGTGLLFSFGLPAYRYYDPYWYGDPYLYGTRRVYRTYALPAAHVRWCHNRWRSYRDWDNSYQPYNGPRRRCRSPYYG